MKLRHYSPYLIAQLEYTDQPRGDIFSTFTKPRGLWVSDDDDFGWKKFCKESNFGLERLRYVYAVTLKPDANILYIKTVKQLDAFTKKYTRKTRALKVGKKEMFAPRPYVDWQKVARDYQGIVITPYQYSRRSALNSEWYYGWDCASGCIWNPDVIESIKLIKPKRKQQGETPIPVAVE